MFEQFEWKVATVKHNILEQALNEHQDQGWEIFAVVPTLRFESTKVVVATVQLPTEIEYNIILRRYK